jgi:hypothetical protein
MQDMSAGAAGEACPFEFNFDEATFKVGDLVSYRVTGMDGFPFVGTLVEVHADHVLIAGDAEEPDKLYRGTRESRPVVDHAEI